jgi:hypothetical protein
VTRRGQVVARIALAVASVLVVLAALELTLRRWPTLLGHAFANGALSRYTTGAGGIYYWDPALRIHFMIPNHRATMYYNGYVWEHETDALGFRNRPLFVPADVVVLGDSVVYGHGVDFEDTLGHRLAQRTGLRVANLGRQGDCAFQEAYLLATHLSVFKPRLVVHVFSPNDVDDLYAHLSDAAMRAFIAQPVDGVTWPPRTDPAALLAGRERKLRRLSLARRLEENLYVAKMLRWLRYRYREWRRTASRAEAAPPRPADVASPSTDPASLGWRYTDHALAYMRHLTGQAGARFLTVPFVEGRQLEILREIAGRHGIEVVDTAPVFAGPSTLPNDGHLSPYGARLMAEVIAARVEGRPAAAPAAPR